MKAGTVCRALSGRIVRESEKALLFQVLSTVDLNTIESQWFPISQLSSIHRTYDEIEGTFDVIMASEWILGQKGMLKYAGVAGGNPVTSAEVPKSSSVMRTIKDTSANRMPYKDDENDAPYFWGEE